MARIHDRPPEGELSHLRAIAEPNKKTSVPAGKSSANEKLSKRSQKKSHCTSKSQFLNGLFAVTLSTYSFASLKKRVLLSIFIGNSFGVHQD